MLARSIDHPGNRSPLDQKEDTMFEELSEELLDLSANVRGHGGAVYAVVDDNTCSSSGICSSVILCCTCTTLCW